MTTAPKCRLNFFTYSLNLYNDKGYNQLTGTVPTELGLLLALTELWLGRFKDEILELKLGQSDTDSRI